MKNRSFLYVISGLALALSVSCIHLDQDNPYENNLYQMKVQLVFPSNLPEMGWQGREVTLSDLNTGAVYSAMTDMDGRAVFDVVNGIYRINSFIEEEDCILQAMEDRVIVASADKEIRLKVEEVKTGNLVIKEIYVGGCTRKPVSTDDYQFDKHIILHNNSDKTIYLDSLCVGTMNPYNSTAHNPWLEPDGDGHFIYPDFIPVMQAVWKIGGDGKTFPLAPGEDAVVVICGAIDHASLYPESVNLNRKDYFVCYNHKFFENTKYHPVPGDQIQPDHILDLVIKTSRGNAFAVSVNSPTILIYRSKGISIEEFVSHSDNILPIPPPSSAEDRVVGIPPEWIIDGVEVFNGSSSKNMKRLIPAIDAGSVVQTAPFKGRALKRKVNKEKSGRWGFEVLYDTNNSSKDFYEDEHPSLWKKKEVK